MTFFNDVKLLDPNKEIVVATEGALPSLDGSRLTNLSVTGDMEKSVYDADNDGVVDTAKTALNIGGKTAVEVAAAVNAAHGHSNKSVLDTITVDNVHAHTNKSLLDSITTESGYLHTHSNLQSLNRLGVNGSGIITIDGTAIDVGTDFVLHTGGQFTGDGTEASPLQLSDTFLSDLIPSVEGLSYLDDGRILCVSYDTGVDENTLALFHFDGTDLMQNDGTYAVNAEIINTAHVNQGATGKFSKCLRAYGAYNTTNNTGWTTRGFAMYLPAISGDWTLDFWIYIDRDNASTINIGSASNHMFPILNNYRPSWEDSGITWQQLVNSWPLPATEQLPVGKQVWSHVALVQYNDIFRVFLNGTIFYQATATHVTLAAGRYLMSCGARDYCYTNMDEFRFSNIARYTTESFTPQSAQYGIPVVSYALSTTKISELLQMASTTVPGRMSAEDKAKLDSLSGDGGLPGGGSVPGVLLWEPSNAANGPDCKFLLDPSQSGGTIADISYGNATPVEVINHGLLVDKNGDMEFTGGETYAVIPAGSLPPDVLTPGTPWTLDLIIKIPTGSSLAGSSPKFFGRNYSTYLNFFLQWDKNSGHLKFCTPGGMSEAYIADLGAPVRDVWIRVTVEYYYDSIADAWGFAVYKDGGLIQKNPDSAVILREEELHIGRCNGANPYPIHGYFQGIRIRSSAPYQGQSFTPDDFPWETPDAPGEWRPISVADLKSDLGLGNVNNTSDADKPISTATQAALDEKASTAPATQTADGLMSAEDKARLDGLESGGTGTGMTEAERTRLLPDDAVGGDIPCFDATATTGGGNDANTRLLLHFDELPLTDTAAGNTSPATVTNSGVTLDTDNFKFGTASAKFANSSNNLKVAVPKALMMSSPWLVDCWFKVDSGQWGDSLRIFTQDDEQVGGWNYYLKSGNRVGVYVRNVAQEETASAPLTPDDWHYATLVYYNAKFYGFVDGVRFTAQDGSTEGFLDYIMLGKRIQSTSYSLRGNIDEFRLQLLDESEISKWIGATIPVPDAPYSKPQTVGEWGKLNKSDVIVRNNADRFLFSGQLKPVSESVVVSGSQTVVLDADMYSRWILSGGGTATLDLENWEDGDKGELVIDTSAVTPVIPADWVTLGADITTNPGLYVLEIAQVGTTVFYAIRYPNSGGAVGSISDHISIVNGYWYLDGVSTGVKAQGDKGDKGDTGATGYVTTVISADQPQNPVDGTIWIQP